MELIVPRIKADRVLQMETFTIFPMENNKGPLQDNIAAAGWVSR